MAQRCPHLPSSPGHRWLACLGGQVTALLRTLHTLAHPGWAQLKGRLQARRGKPWEGGRQALLWAMVLAGLFLLGPWTPPQSSPATGDSGGFRHEPGGALVPQCLRQAQRRVQLRVSMANSSILRLRGE